MKRLWNYWLFYTSFLIINVTFLIASSSNSESYESENESENYDPLGLNFESMRVGNYSSDDEASNYNVDTELDDAFEELKLKDKKKKSSTVTNSASLQRPLTCVDGNGTEVDWWFAYKEPNGKRYLYYRSIDAKEGHKSFLPLNHRHLIDDPETSPVIKTIYHPGNSDASEVWLGWNDQPENDDEEPEKKKKQKKATSSPIDGFGAKVDAVKHAHSKGFYAQNAIRDANNDSTATVGSYLMMTSLPRFPKLESASPANFGGALRNRLPPNPRDIFDSNLGSKAQHFFCINFPRETIVLDSNDEAKVDFEHAHVKFLHKYLKTIHPAIMGTNFTDQKLHHQIWRRYFSLLSKPYHKAIHHLNHPDIAVQLQAYEASNLPSLKARTTHKPVEDEYLHVFPLTSSKFYVGENGYIYNYSHSNSHSHHFTHRWEAQYSKQNGCRTGLESTCFASFSLKTTTQQSGLELHFFAKHGAALMDLWDDWAALQIVHAQKSLSNCYTGETVDRYGLLVQSWTDSRTVLPKKTDKKIFERENALEATVHIDNVSHLLMPVRHASALRVSSSGTDHAKWALGFALDTFNSRSLSELRSMDYSFVSQVFVGDLNRTTTQACLKDKSHGRGGGAVAISDPFLWRALLELQPRAPRQKFIHSGKIGIRNIQTALLNHTASKFKARPLPLSKTRSSVFKSLRLSRREAKTQKKAVAFVPMLNELSSFIKKAQNKSEHAAAHAFQLLFQNFAQGKIEGSAEAVWSRTEKEIKILEKDEDYAVLALETWPKIFEIPSIHVHREIPTSDATEYWHRWTDLEEQTPHIIRKSDGSLSTIQEHELNFNGSGNPVNAETQTNSTDNSSSIEIQTDFFVIEPENSEKSKLNDELANVSSMESVNTGKIAHPRLSQEQTDHLFDLLDSIQNMSINQEKQRQQQFRPHLMHQNENDEYNDNNDDGESDQRSDSKSSDSNDESSNNDESNENYDESESNFSDDVESTDEDETEYFDHVRRSWRENDGEDYEDEYLEDA